MRCQATTKSGEPCKAAPLRGGAFCFTHEPARARERAAARKRGGLNRQTPKGVAERPGAVRSVGDVLAWINAALVDTWLQENSAQRSRTVGYLCGVALRALEVGELEERLAALEVAING